MSVVSVCVAHEPLGDSGVPGFEVDCSSEEAGGSEVLSWVSSV